MRHFNYFENGGPAPSACLSCGRDKELFDLGRELPYGGGMAQVCMVCVKELALFIGFAEEAPLKKLISELEDSIDDLDGQLNKVPNLVDGLINGIRGSVTDFIFAVSYGIDADKPAPVQDATSSDSGEHEASKITAGQRKAPVKPSSK